MVLEETLLFSDEEDADEFISFLRENHCRAQKITDSAVFNETLVTGPINGLIRFFEQEYLDAVSTEENPKTSPGMPELPVVKSLKAIRAFVGDVMDRTACGELIYTTDEFKQMKEDMSAEVETQLKAVDIAEQPKLGIDIILKVLTDRSSVFSSLRAMEDAGWVKTEPEGIRLLQKNNPNDLPAERSVHDEETINRDTLKELDLVLNDHIYYEPEFRLVIDPRIHVACTADEVEEALDGLEVDEESEDTLLDNMDDKRVAIDAILDAISDAGKCSIEDLIEKMDDVPLEMEDSTNQLTAHLSPAYVTSLVNDLRKIGVIEGNDRKLRAVR